MKKILINIAIITGFLFVLGPGKDWVIQSVATAGSRGILGANLKMNSFSLNLFTQSLRIRGLKVYNPEGFDTDKIMLDIPEIALDLDTLALLHQALHVKYMRLDLREARVIKNEKGELNVNALKVASKKDAGSLNTGSGKESRQKKMVMRFDLVSLNVGQVILEDHTGGKTPPRISTYRINLKNREFRNMNSAEEFAASIMFSALTPAGLGNAFSLGAKVVGKTVDTVEHTIGGIFKGLKIK